MRDSAALRVSIALGAFVLLQGADGGVCGSPEPATPSKSMCVADGEQEISLAPLESTELLRCNPSTSDRYYSRAMDEFVSLVAGSASGAALEVETGDFYTIRPAATAAIGDSAKATYEFKRRKDGVLERAAVKVTVIDFHVNIEPTWTAPAPSSPLVVPYGTTAELRAVVAGPVVETHQFSWRVDDSLDGSDEPIVQPDQADTLVLPSLAEGRYTVTVDVLGDMLGPKNATAEVAIVEGPAAVFLVDASCSSTTFADPHFDLDCSEDGMNTSATKVCARFEVVMANGDLASSVAPSITENGVRSTANGIAFCKQAATDAAITGFMTIHRTNGGDVEEPFRRTFR